MGGSEVGVGGVRGVRRGRGRSVCVVPEEPAAIWRKLTAPQCRIQLDKLVSVSIRGRKT